MDIQFRETEQSPAITVGYDDFKDRIRRGEVGPKTLVRDRVLTNDEWWTLDNLNVFHNASPVTYPPGEHLSKRREATTAREDAQQRSRRQFVDYINGNLIELRFELKPLDSLLGGADFIGATRLFVLRSFEPERIFTFVFKQGSITIDVVQGRTSLWHSLPQVVSVDGVWQEIAASVFKAAESHKAVAEISSYNAPEPFKGWNRVLTAARRSSSCSTLGTDGVTFRHQLVSPTDSLAARWDNPVKTNHLDQVGFIEAYHECIKAAGLDRFWSGRSL